MVYSGERVASLIVIWVVQARTAIGSSFGSILIASADSLPAVGDNS